LPVDAKLMLPGLALAYVMSSSTLVAGNDRFISMTLAMRPTLAIGAMSPVKLKLRFG